MPFKIADAFVEIRGDKGKFSRTIRLGKAEMKGFARSATRNINQITSGFGLMEIAAVAAAVAISVKLTRAIIRAGKSAIQTAVQYDRLKVGLAAVAGGAEEAARQLIRLETVAKLPGLSFEGAIQGSTALQAAGLSAQLAERSLLAFGNALVTVGKGADDLKGVNLALTQIVTKGTGFGQELRQLAERLPQVRKAMKDAFGIGSVQDFKKLGLSAEEFITGIVTEFEKLPKLSGIVANDLENLGIAFDRLKAEIGKTMLGITGDTAKSLTSILDRIRIIIPVWTLYRDEVAAVFEDVVTIVLETTGRMMKGMIKIIAAAAPLLFKPLKKATISWIRDFDAGVRLFLNDISKNLGRSKEKYEEIFIEIMDSLQTAQNKAAAEFEIEYAAAIKNLVDTGTKELPKMSTAWLESLQVIDDKLKAITDKIPQQAVVAGDKIQDAFAGLDLDLGFGTGFDIVAFKQELAGSVELGFKLANAFRMIGVHSKEWTDQMAEFRKTQQEALKEIGSALARGFRSTTRQSEESKRQWKEFWEAQRQSARNFIGMFESAFVDLFADLFTGQTKKLWENFWTDMVRIATRKLAQLAVSKGFDAIADLFNNIRGVGSDQGRGGGSNVNPFSEISNIIETSGIANNAAPARQMQVNVIFPNADIEHMSQARIERAVQSQIVPAFRRLQKRGIIAQRM